MERIELDSAVLEYDGKIIYVTFTGTADVDEEEAEKHIQAAHKLTKGASAAVLVDTTLGFSNVSPEARKILAGIENSIPKVAEAMVIKSLPNRLLFRFYQKRDNPDNPVKAFSNREDALDWLKAFI